MERKRQSLTDFTGIVPWDNLTHEHPTLERLDNKVPDLIVFSARILKSVVEISHEIRQKITCAQSEQ